VIEVYLRPRAEVDLVERTTYYAEEGGHELGNRFFEAAVETLSAIGRMPGAGSPQVGEWCGIPGLRTRRIPGFPCSWCYFVGDHVDVVRLLADAQDLPALLADEQAP
jgi:toxin ParE1/3/4